MDNTLKSMNLEFLGNGKHKVSIEKLFENKNSVFLDLRDNKEVEVLKFNLDSFGIETKQIPINELPDRLNELEKDKLIACFCSAGTRANWAFIYLFSKGYKVKILQATNESLAKILTPGKVLKNKH